MTYLPLRDWMSLTFSKVVVYEKISLEKLTSHPDSYYSNSFYLHKLQRYKDMRNQYFESNKNNSESEFYTIFSLA